MRTREKERRILQREFQPFFKAGRGCGVHLYIQHHQREGEKVRNAVQYQYFSAITFGRGSHDA